MKPFEAGERVTWKIMDHGKEKKIIGYFVSATGGTAQVDVPGKGRMSTVLGRLNRCRGRKPAGSAEE
jgi:hypothetical protein